MIAKYKVVESSDAGTLEKSVNEFIEKGWKPQGGIAISVLPRLKSGKANGYFKSETDFVSDFDFKSDMEESYCQALIFEVDE